MKLPSVLVTWLLRKAFRRIGAAKPDVLIGPDNDPYMKRWFIIPRNRVFNIYLHYFLHDDERTLHSHPWWSVSVALHGVMSEFSTPTSMNANRIGFHRFRYVKAGEVVVRSTDMFHRLELVSATAITLFFTGPKLCTWYFACKAGLVKWTDFVSSRDTGQIGAGCGEHDDYPAK
jgi:hypothetical protein